jgi:hypothetical protein
MVCQLEDHRNHPKNIQHTVKTSGFRWIRRMRINEYSPEALILGCIIVGAEKVGFESA